MRIRLFIFGIFMFFPPILLSGDSGEYSGFLGDYPDFHKNRQTGAKVWFHSQDEGVHVLRPYRKILLTPIEVWLDDDSHKGINPNTLSAMTEYFTLAIHKKLDHGYEFVNQPGPGVLILRIAITNVKYTKPTRKWYGYVPVALVVEGGTKAARAAVGETVDLIEATVELEGLDSVTEQRIVAAIDTHQSDKIKRQKDSPASWGPIKEIFDYWAERISIRMDEARDLQ